MAIDNNQNVFFKARFAGLSVGIGCLTPELRDFCADYIANDDTKEDINIRITPDDIAAEAARTADGTFTPLMHEISAVHRAVAEKLPFFDRIVMHGAAITYLDGAYMFCAPSGTGKSTHISLWRRYLGSSVDIINGDKPFLSLGTQNDDRIYVHGSPWSGKERWQKNRSAPLRAICFISRSGQNSITTLPPEKCLQMLMRQVYMPQSADAAHATLGLIDRLVRIIPLYHLCCNISEDAVRCSFEALTGTRYHSSQTDAVE